ncbi:Hint domain-containing protein [Gluconobacter wancherniae]|uniref:Hint domain-containing protein n=1 Tax=Gluconobacter wancherniae TaxID=1307955 RepID=UPI001B8C7BF9|nr:Hint domain-containing protein [Gluconobacter wancherniae]MBS1093260.1 Hint domain-containing protein [Gluconobacter wancherniae]
MEIGDKVTLTVNTNSTSQVFNSNTLTIDQGGTLTFNTPSSAALGSVKINGTLQIFNSASTITTSSRSFDGTGTVVLDNSSIGNPTSLGGMGSLTTVLNNGSTLYLNGNMGGAGITFGTRSTTGQKNSIALPDYHQSFTTPIKGLDANSTITALKSSNVPQSASLTSNNDGTYTLTKVSLGANSAPGQPTFVSNTDGSWSVENIATGSNAVCYLEGTMLLTPDGERAVESLKAGEMISVREGALADGIPSRDLLVTPEQCMALDDGFIPARMLVNGMSIIYDRTITDYNYYHVETLNHSILIAEGALSESYLDCGHRSDALMGDAQVTRLHALTWEKDAALPLLTERTRVETIYMGLVERAASLGYEPSTTHAPVNGAASTGLYLQLENGGRLRAMRVRGDQHLFMLPEGIDTVRIVSGAARPFDTIGPFVDDRRMLGVLVGTATLWDGGSWKEMTSHLTSISTDGWCNVEDGTMRWTNGNARLDLGSREPNASALLSLRIIASSTDASTTAAKAA